MTSHVLLVVMLTVSATSLALQGSALRALWQRKASGGVERVVARGYVRTVACRTVGALIYTMAASFQLAGARVHGGDLTPEALVIFVSMQALWLANTVSDLRLRGHLSGQGKDGRP